MKPPVSFLIHHLCTTTTNLGTLPFVLLISCPSISLFNNLFFLPQLFISITFLLKRTPPPFFFLGASVIVAFGGLSLVQDHHNFYKLIRQSIRTNTSQAEIIYETQNTYAFLVTDPELEAE